MNVRTYLRGLTPGRVGVVVLICAILTARQLMACHPHRCAILGTQTLLESTAWQIMAGSAQFLGRSVLWALPMLFAVTIADNATARARRGVRVSVLVAAVLLGAIVYGVGFWFTQPSIIQTMAGGQFFQVIPRIGAHFARAALYGGLATAVLYFFSRERADAQAAQQSKLSKLALDRQTVEARLQALQAQIEPHFLFNTLANVKLLYEFEPAKARTLVRDLAVYLRTALPQMRASRTTLAHELDMAQAYLRVIKMRMGDRLRVEIDAPNDLRHCALPPMMLSTLVENAIKHGLNPLPRGGTLAIRASRGGASLRIDVVDDGAGFHGRFGPGVGLSNTRARLAALYGTAGHLTLNTNPEGGVTATIEVPYAAVVQEATA
jgi:sensor histidine kinase YesM